MAQFVDGPEFTAAELTHALHHPPRVAFGVLQRAAILVLERTRDHIVPAVEAIVKEARAAQRWPTARRVVLASRLSELHGAQLQLDTLRRMVARELGRSGAAAPTEDPDAARDAPGVANVPAAAARVAAALERMADQCRRVDDAALSLLCRG